MGLMDFEKTVDTLFMQCSNADKAIMRTMYERFKNADELEKELRFKTFVRVLAIRDTQNRKQHLTVDLFALSSDDLVQLARNIYKRRLAS